MSDSKRSSFIKGMRAFADLLEAHEVLPIPYEGSNIPSMLFFFEDDAREKMAEAARVLGGNLRKGGDNETFHLRGALHGFEFKLIAMRNAVCTREVVGTEEIEVPDPEVKVPRIKKTIEKVEWKCHPLLGGDEEAEISRGQQEPKLGSAAFPPFRGRIIT